MEANIGEAIVIVFLWFVPIPNADSIDIHYNVEESLAVCEEHNTEFSDTHTEDHHSICLPITKKMMEDLKNGTQENYSWEKDIDCAGECA